MTCTLMLFASFFFFSSRRRHTRLQGDWSSDVCSSDLSPDHVAGGHDHEAFHHVAELAHVPGPVVGDEVAERLARDGLEPLAVLPAEERDEVVHEQRDVVLALAQGGHLDRDDIETVVEVLPEAPVP